MSTYSPAQTQFTVDAPFFEPLTLPGASERRNVLAFLLLLAAVLHFGSIGWGQLYDGPEAWNAAMTRNSEAGSEAVSPLLQLALATSYRVFGFSDWAARIPVAAATVFTVWLVFLLGERFGGTWQGFTAGLAFLCTPGCFVVGRAVSPEPLGTAFICAALLCGIRGFRMRRRRRWWFLGVWLNASFASLAIGAIGWFIPLGLFGIAALVYPDARIRVRSLFALEGIFLFLLVQGPWIYSRAQQPFLSALMLAPGVGESGLRSILWMFPWSIFVGAGAILAVRQICERRRLEFKDGVAWTFLLQTILLYWLAGGVCDLASPLIWAPAALVAAAAWNNLRQVGQIVLLSVILVLVLPLSFGSEWLIVPRLEELASVPKEIWPWFRWMVILFASGMTFFTVTALVFSIRSHQRLPIVALAASVLPLGFALMEMHARLAPYFSAAEVAEFLNEQARIDAEVYYEGSPMEISSLMIYSDRDVKFGFPKPSEKNSEKMVYVICPHGEERTKPGWHLAFRGTRFCVIGSQTDDSKP